MQSTIPTDENTTVEFKRELTKSLEQEVVAFLNSEKGGIVYVGVDDKGQVIGVKNPQEVQLSIQNRIRDNIAPPTLGLFDVVVQEVEDKKVIRINVTTGNIKPYYIKKYGLSPKGAYVRVGVAKEPMTREMIEKLSASAPRNVLGNIPSPLKDLTFGQLKIYYEEKGFNVNDNFLHNLDLYTPNGEFNYAAYLLADDNRVSVKVAKYDSTDKVELIENEEYGFCSLLKATEKVLDKLDIENKTFTQVTGRARRFEKRMVDSTALREALINAMVHNDYSSEVFPVVELYADRLSITSYGGLHVGLSQAEFFQGRSFVRNRELMRVYRDIGLVEQLGSGMNRILSKYPQDIFRFSENFLEVCFDFEHDYQLSDETVENDGEKPKMTEKTAKNDGVKSKMTEKIAKNDGKKSKMTEKTADKILLLVRQNANVTIQELSDAIGVKHRAIERNLKQLKEQNKIKRIGPNKGGHWEVIDG